MLLVRSSDAPGAVASVVRDVVRRFDPGLPIQAFGMEDVVSVRLAQERVFASVLGALATIGFLLAAIGIHGLVSQAVVERMREFGIRLASGAEPSQVIRLVLRSALLVVLTGGPLGLLLAAGLAQVMRSRLYGVTPGEPPVYVTALTALFLVSVGASIVPAWAASRVNPVDVLRAE